jgi:hypothetical protein
VVSTAAQDDPARIALAETAHVSQSRYIYYRRPHEPRVHPSFRKDAVNAGSFILPIFHLAVMIGKGSLPQY